MIDDYINKVVHGDCLEVMKQLPDKCVDCVITSPPYNMNLRIRKGQYCSRQLDKTEFSHKYDHFDDNLPIEEFYLTHKAILSQALRVGRIVFYNIAVVTGSKRAFFKMMGDFSDNIKDIIIWDKGFAEPAMSEGVLNRQSELILVLEDNGISRRFERGGLGDVWKIKKEASKDNAHSATFPLELPSKIINNFTREGEIVLDPFLGSGTTAVAAKLLNRRYIGIELYPEYCAIAERRLAQQTLGI